MKKEKSSKEGPFIGVENMPPREKPEMIKQMSTEELYARVIEELLRHVIERMNVLVSQNSTVGRMYEEVIRREMDKLRAEVKATRAKLRRKA
jgi:hypothetical protein